MKKTLLTISDGNGVNNDFHKWPFLLQTLTTKNLNVVNRSVVGASNEMMLLRLAETLCAHPINYAIIQWSAWKRIDVVADDFWKEQAKIDPVYHFNLVKLLGKDWWVTSASKNPYIQEYHNRYMDITHAKIRSQSFIMSAAEMLKHHNVDFRFALMILL